jgi:hypothetical protein
MIWADCFGRRRVRLRRGIIPTRTPNLISFSSVTPRRGRVAAEIVSGQPVAAVGTTIAAIALQAAKNAEKAGVNVATHDMSAAITGYLANLKATGVAATAAQTATTAQANAA